MAVRKYKPTTPGRRGASVSSFEEITRGMREAERRALFHDNALRIYRMR